MKKYDNVQIFRVAACLGVFITHLAPRMGVTGRLASVANFGASGVYLFFMISGFLACCSREIQPGSPKRGILAYYCKRMLRVLPLYYAVILYNVVLHELILQDVPADPGGLYWFRYLFLTNAFLPAPDNFWSNLCATWTVSLFCVFYLCAPALVRIVGGRGKKTNILCAAALYLGLLLLRYLWVEAGLSAYMMCLYYLHYFVLGMLVRQLADHYRPGKAAVLFGIFAAALWGIAELGGAGNDYFTCVSWIFAELLLLTGEFSPKHGRAFKIIDQLDVHSYAIYLVHAVVLDGIGLLRAHVPFNGMAVLAIALILTAAGARIAHLLIEQPAEKLSRSLVAALKT